MSLLKRPRLSEEARGAPLSLLKLGLKGPSLRGRRRPLLFCPWALRGLKTPFPVCLRPRFGRAKRLWAALNRGSIVVGGCQAWRSPKILLWRI